MEKKGQLTLFIILAVLIVAIVAVLFMFGDNLFGEKNKNDLEIAPIINFVQDCIDKTLNQSIYVIASNGGYSGYSYLNRGSNEVGVKYYLIGNQNYIPSKRLVENQIKEYFERKFFLCINDFSDFSNYNIKRGTLKASVEIREGEVRLNARYPLYIKQDKKAASVNSFESVASSRFNVVYDSVVDYVFQQRGIRGTCLGCLNLAVKNGIYIDIQNYYDGSVVLTFIDKSSETDEVPIKWRFANKY